MNTVPDHNAERWLTVRWFDNRLLPAGWYVVRTCPCHWGMRVTEARESKAAAERSKAAMLKVAS